jgi:uncharacterized protein
VNEPRWLVDEMLGRLARYLRFLGYDTEYVQGATDDEIVQRARRERRRIITRDRLLARRLPDAILLTRTDIAGQLGELRAGYAALRSDVRFDRCSVCNGTLSALAKVPSQAKDVENLPPEVRAGRAPLFACSDCGHLYWEGTHTKSVRARLSQWFSSEPVTG